jgi:ABC-2 type transport system ATP-binding protein
LAQAIAHNPPILILDEPTVGLDPRQIIDIRNLIKSLGGEHTVILSTHILPEVQATCGRVVVIDRGKVVATDTLSGIAARMQTDMLVHLTLAKDPAASIAKINAIAGVVTISAPANTSGQFSLRIECARGADPRAVIAQLCVQENLGLLELQQQKLSLEDAFVKLISRDLANEITREPSAEST